MGVEGQAQIVLERPVEDCENGLRQLVQYLRGGTLPT